MPDAPPATRPLSDREWMSFQLLMVTTWRSAVDVDDGAWLDWRSRLAGFTAAELEQAVTALASSPFLPTWKQVSDAARPARRARYARWWEAHGA